ncbi:MULTISPECIES: hypothetical protein [unclassified Shewanella]|uniref:hypothetical protein n=1 Tax=unclassified Shewanella TaxID=196818 RepID=UPI0021D9A02B|nr:MULTISPECIES: hypothetical protein [unclassified Shewanella]MCU8024396.1 hypothetical protein [Shewanella sp. SM78]MCU8078514.1 hypothetical protein [Shewanella sp. SM103]
MFRILLIILLFTYARNCIAVPEKQLINIVDAIYCSAFLEYVNSGDTYDKIKSRNLIKKADEINSSLMPDYRTNVIEDRSKYVLGLVTEKIPIEVARQMYDQMGCDLKF